MRNPFEIDGSLVNIASGKVAPIDVCQESKGNRLGEQNCKNFISGQLLTDEQDLFATLKATKLKRFSTMEKKTQAVKTSKGQVVELNNDIKFASRLLAVAKAREINMKDVLTYSLRKFPSPIATADRNHIKTSKAKLMHEIEKRVENPDVEFISADNALLLDGRALVQMIKHIHEFFGRFVEVMLKRILSLASNARSERIDFIRDVYPDVTIKNIEGSKRAENDSTVIRILSPEQKVPR